MSYDAWGQRRVASTWQAGAVTTSEHRGYTGHEHLDDIGVIHMNGRIYSPSLGRVLSPDPVTQAPQNGQNYNRYTYVFNNPLRYTDPSGLRGETGKVHCTDACAPNRPAVPGFLEETLVTASFPRRDSNAATLGFAYGGSTGAVGDRISSHYDRTIQQRTEAGDALSDNGEPVLVPDGAASALEPGQCDEQGCRAFMHGRVSGAGVRGSTLPILQELSFRFPILDQDLVDFAAGVGDALLFGAGPIARETMSIDGGIDPTSSSYAAGFTTGFATSAAIGGGTVSLGFRSSGPLRMINQNRHFRIGYGSHQGHSVFRLGGNYVERLFGRRHIDLGDAGPL
jgi:RHS repeat-associated protein